MSGEALAWAIASGAIGIVCGLIAFIGMGFADRQRHTETRVDLTEDRQVETRLDHDKELTRLQVKVEMLMEDRKKCDDLIERMARAESFQGWAEPLLAQAVAGLNKAVEFEARFDERLITLFKGFNALQQRMDRAITLITPQQPAVAGAQSSARH